MHGLTASDFTLLENGQPRKISFFEADDEPISLAILIDSGRTMDFGGKPGSGAVVFNFAYRRGTAGR